jgi:DNA-binding FadR family transcriptional regulator
MMPSVTEINPDVASAARDAVFAPIGGEGLVQQTVRRLGEAIGLGLLGEGERLPPEAELAARFEISAMTLRQALAILRESGYIETRRGRSGGTVVRSATPFPVGARARERFGELTVEELRELTDYRAAISGHAAALAAERATPEEVDRLAALAEEMARPREFADYRRLDSTFHLGVAAAARVRRLVEAEAAVQGELAPMLAVAGDEPAAGTLVAANEQHVELVAALRAGDAARARHVMELHVAGTAEMLIGLRLGMMG